MKKMVATLIVTNLIIITLVFNHYSLCMEITPEEREAQQFRLLKLTDEQMEAGVRKSEFYSTMVDFPTLHQRGDVIEESFLGDFFFKTIFQYYTHEFLDFDMTYNYSQKGLVEKPDFATAIKFRLLAEKLQPRQTKGKKGIMIIQMILPLIKPLLQAINSFKQNKLLQQLGVAYMRQKIVTEKFGGLIIKDFPQDLKEKIQPLLLQHDRFAIDLQTMIYHFMKEAYEQYISNLKAAQTDPKKMAAGKFLATFVPSFTQYPYYKELVSRLEELGKPIPVSEETLPKLLAMTPQDTINFKRRLIDIERANLEKLSAELPKASDLSKRLLQRKIEDARQHINSLEQEIRELSVSK